MQAAAFYHTENAAKYLQQLAKHFAHKIQVDLTDTTADFALQSASVRLTAQPEGLRAEIGSDTAAGLIEARFVIDKHLVTYAFREAFIGMNWIEPD